MKEDTAIKQLLDSFYTSEQLGLRQMNIGDVIKHIKKFQHTELRNMQDCFIAGMDFEDKKMDCEKAADNYVKQSYTWYLWQTL